MKCSRLCLSILLIVPLFTFAQKYHEPAEILKILSDSRLTYDIGMLQSPEIKTVEYPPQLNHGLFLKKMPNGTRVVTTYDSEFDSVETYKPNLMTAESAYANKEFSQARLSYIKALLAAPNSSQVMTFIGQSFEAEHAFDSAKVWYLRAIDANFYDYMAHWFLADIHWRQQSKDSAITEICLARIMNRNNPRLSASFVRIFKDAEINYSDWEFHPAINVEQLPTNHISVTFDEKHSEWLPYALCKALWKFEPDYRKSMLSRVKGLPAVIEETECVMNVIIGLENSKTSTDDKSLKAAKEALEGNMFSEFIVYDVILPGEPYYAFNLSREFMKNVAQYITKVRTKT